MAKAKAKGRLGKAERLAFLVEKNDRNKSKKRLPFRIRK